MPAILVVKDEENQQLALEEELTGEGYTVVSAANAEEALGKVSATTPDLVLLGVGMPTIRGLELSGRLREMSSRVPVVILTACTRYWDSYMSRVADAYVIEQSDLGKLKNTVHRVLREPERSLAEGAGV